jgi:hypothetical protein
MSKKGKGLLALVAGAAAGAAAIFLSKEENRQKTVKAVNKAKRSATRVVKTAQRKRSAAKNRTTKK